MAQRMTPPTPTYRHDCDSCTFLFTHKRVDVYKMCNRDKGLGFVLRYGDQGSAYASSEQWDLLEAIVYANKHIINRLIAYP